MTSEFPYLKPGFIPYAHQREHLLEHRDDEYHALFWETGSAKTMPVLATGVHHFLLGNIDLLVVFAPNTVNSNWVLRELPKCMDPDLPILSYIWDGTQTKKAAAIREEFLAATGKLKVITVNFEAMSAHKRMVNNKAIRFLAQLLKAHEGRIMGAIDESDAIGDPKSTRSKRILKFGPHFKLRRITTGTPATESPFLLYSQCEFLKPGLLGYPSYEAFTLTHGIFKTKKFGKVGKTFVQCVGYRNLPILKEKLRPFSSYKKKSECLDLPPKLYEIRTVTMTPEQTAAYRQMRELLVHAVTNTEGVVEFALAKNALHKLRKLHDIVIGYARVEVPYVGPPDQKPKNPVYKVLPLPTNRPAALIADLERLQGKVIIFTDCKPALLDLVPMLKKKFGEASTVACYGGVPKAQRNESIDAFQDLASPVRFFVANQKTGGVGLTLTAASYVAFYSNGYSLRLRMQAEDRAHRGGLTHSVTYLDYVVPGTVDEKVFQAFEDKVDVASQVVPLFDFFMGNRVLTPEEREATTAPMDLDQLADLLADD